MKKKGCLKDKEDCSLSENEADIKTLYNELHHMNLAIDEINKTLKGMADKFVSRKEVEIWQKLIEEKLKSNEKSNAPLTKIVYNVITVIITAVVVALLSLVIIKT